MLNSDVDQNGAGLMNILKKKRIRQELGQRGQHNSSLCEYTDFSSHFISIMSSIQHRVLNIEL